jgi:hypothetical protein
VGPDAYERLRRVVEQSCAAAGFSTVSRVDSVTSRAASASDSSSVPAARHVVVRAVQHEGPSPYRLSPALTGLTWGIIPGTWSWPEVTIETTLEENGVAIAASTTTVRSRHVVHITFLPFFWVNFLLASVDEQIQKAITHTLTNGVGTSAQRVSAERRHFVRRR